MRKLLLLIMVGLLALCAYGCGGNATETQVPTPTPGITPVPTLQASAGIVPAAEHSALEVVKTVAYFWPQQSGGMLYGAVEYKNTGNTSIVLGESSLAFSVDGRDIPAEFERLANSADILTPGMTSYLAVWLPTEETINPGAQITLNAVLTAQKTEDVRLRLSIKNLFVADNSPKFSTVSGTINNISGDGCEVNIIYIGFYDENDELLYVWHFTKDARLELEESKNFVDHMAALPPGIGEKTARLNAVGFGIN